MRSEKSKVIGNIGDFEVKAKWQWKLQLNAVTLWIIVVSSVLLLFLSLGFVYFRTQCHKLADIQVDIQSELRELKKLKQELQDLKYLTSELPPNQLHRSKRELDSSGRARAVHLERNVSYTETGATGIISYWHPQRFVDPIYSLENVRLEDRDSSLVIQQTGLYLIYAQLCYAVTRENNSFEVKVMSEGRTHSESKIISQCSAGTTLLENEITCFTSIVQVLRAGDRVYLQQTQKSRQLLMNMGRSFMGVVKL